MGVRTGDLGRWKWALGRRWKDLECNKDVKCRKTMKMHLIRLHREETELNATDKCIVFGFLLSPGTFASLSCL